VCKEDVRNELINKNINNREGIKINVSRIEGRQM
jgi:hypothetical protein